MKLIDKIIDTLEYFTERQYEEVQSCIPNPEHNWNTDWQSDLGEQVRIYNHYRISLKAIRDSRSVLSIDIGLLDQVIEHINDTDEG